MKKIIILACVSIAFFFGGAGAVEAASLTPAQIDAVINLLRAFGADDRIIADVNASLTGSGANVFSVSSSSVAYCPNLTRTLYRGSSDAWTNGQVSMLQTFLSELYTGMLVTGYFGPLTESGVKVFQADHGIPSIGIVGPMTRAKIGSLCSGAATTGTASSQASVGRLFIEPASASVTIGGTKTLQAVYAAPVPKCPEGAYCAQVTPAPIPVVAEWTSSNSSIASIDTIGNCVAIECPTPTSVLVKGVSNGTVDIKAAYKTSSGVLLTAVVKVTASAAPISVIPPTKSSITVISPNGGESWQIGKTYSFNWTSRGIDYVDIILSNSSGYGEIKIASGVSASSGSYPWFVPATIPVRKDYSIRIEGGPFIEAKGARTYLDESDAPFSINLSDSDSAATRDAKRNEDLAQIARAINSYFKDNDAYPGADIPNTFFWIKDNNYSGKLPCATTPGGLKPYLASVCSLNDPQGSPYAYAVRQNGMFVLGARFEQSAYKAKVFTYGDNKAIPYEGYYEYNIPIEFGAVNLKDYAPGDGSLQTTAVRNAFNAGAPTIICPAGKYKIGTVTIPTSVHFITGEAGCIFEQAAQDSDVLSGTNNANLVIRGITFTMVGADRSASGNNAIALTGSGDVIGNARNVTVRDVYIKNSQHRGVLISYASGVRIENVTCDTCSGGPLVQNVTDAKLIGNKVFMPQLKTAFSTGISVNTTQNNPSSVQHNQRVELTNNVVTDYNKDQAFLIHDCIDCVFSGNVATNALDGLGLQVVGGGTQKIERVTVTNFQYTGASSGNASGEPGNYAIAVGGDTNNPADSVTISGGTLTNANAIVKSSGEGAIKISGDTNNLKISSVVIKSPYSSGVVVNGFHPNKNMSISGLNITGVLAASDGTRACIYVRQGSGHSGAIWGNSCDGAQAVKIESGVSVTGLQISAAPSESASSLAAVLMSLERQIEELEAILESLLAP